MLVPKGKIGATHVGAGIPVINLKGIVRSRITVSGNRGLSTVDGAETKSIKPTVDNSTITYLDSFEVISECTYKEASQVVE